MIHSRTNTAVPASGVFLRTRGATGFTLIELSVVLVIIGLIVGGVLVGQGLIKAATIQAQITQIHTFNTAANTFRVKFGYLPGDIPDPPAVGLGFQPRGPYAGEGDGNGVLEGNYGPSTTGAPGSNYGNGFNGENAMFWRDLSTAGLVNGFAAASMTAINAEITASTLQNYMPTAKLNGDSVYTTSSSGVNYFGVSAVTGVTLNWCTGCIATNPGVTVAQAYAIDNKIDDGFPQTGAVVTLPFNYFVDQNGNNTWNDGLNHGPVDNSATLPSPNTCYDNGGVKGTQNYSMSQNNGAGSNCALSFRFQ